MSDNTQQFDLENWLRKALWKYWPVLLFMSGMYVHMLDLMQAGLIWETGVTATFEHILFRPSGWIAIASFLPLFWGFIWDQYP